MFIKTGAGCVLDRHKHDGCKYGHPERNEYGAASGSEPIDFGSHVTKNVSQREKECAAVRNYGPDLNRPQTQRSTAKFDPFRRHNVRYDEHDAKRRENDVEVR